MNRAGTQNTNKVFIVEPIPYDDIFEQRYYVKDMGRLYGPMSWSQVKALIDRGKISYFGKVKEESWPKWEPVAYYFIAKKQEEIRQRPPDFKYFIYAAILYFGLFVLIFGLIVYISLPWMGVILFILSALLLSACNHYDKRYNITKKGRRGFIIMIIFLYLMLIFVLFFIEMIR